MRIYTILLLTLFVLVGCSNQFKNSASQSSTLVHKDDIKPYLEQWDNHKEQITRLSMMEEDLSLLIQALSAQTKLDTVPDSMKEGVEFIEYGSKQPLQPTTSIVQPNKVVNLAEPIYVVQIGRYMIEQGAENQIQRLKEQYPQLSTILQYSIKKQTKQSSTFYNVLAGPLESQQQAAQLCLFFYKIGNTCALVTSKQGT